MVRLDKNKIKMMFKYHDVVVYSSRVWKGPDYIEGAVSFKDVWASMKAGSNFPIMTPPPSPTQTIVPATITHIGSHLEINGIVTVETIRLVASFLTRHTPHVHVTLSPNIVYWSPIRSTGAARVEDFAFSIMDDQHLECRLSADSLEIYKKEILRRIPTYSNHSYTSGQLNVAQVRASMNMYQPKQNP